MKFLKWLDGKKTTIAGLYWAVALPALAIIWPENVPEVVEKSVQLTGLVLTYIGLGHKVTKGAVK